MLLDSPNGRPNHHTYKSRSEIQERFHVMSWRAYFFSKRMKRRSCWCFKPKAFFLFQCICAEHVSVNALLAPCRSIIKTKFITGFILPNSLLFSVSGCHTPNKSFLRMRFYWNGFCPWKCSSFRPCRRRA